VDFTKKNLGLSREIRNIDFEKSRDMIDKVYQSIKQRKDFGLDLTNITQIQQCLNPKLKQIISKNYNYF